MALVSVTLTQRHEMGTSACISAFMSMCYVSEYTRILWNKNRVWIFLLQMRPQDIAEVYRECTERFTNIHDSCGNPNQNRLNVSA